MAHGNSTLTTKIKNLNSFVVIFLTIIGSKAVFRMAYSVGVKLILHKAVLRMAYSVKS